MRGTEVLGFLFSWILPKKNQSKLVAKALQKAPTADCGVFDKAKAINRGIRNSIMQDREIGKPMDFADLKDTLNSNGEAMDVMRGIMAEADLVKVKGLYDGPTTKSVASKYKNIVDEFISKSGHVIDDEEMHITQDFIDKKLGHSFKTTLKPYNSKKNS